MHPEGKMFKRTWNKVIKEYKRTLVNELEAEFRNWSTPPVFLNYNLDHETSGSGSTRQRVEVEFPFAGVPFAGVAGPPTGPPSPRPGAPGLGAPVPGPVPQPEL